MATPAAKPPAPIATEPAALSIDEDESELPVEEESEDPEEDDFEAPDEDDFEAPDEDCEFVVEALARPDLESDAEEEPEVLLVFTPDELAEDPEVMVEPDESEVGVPLPEVETAACAAAPVEPSISLFMSLTSLGWAP